MKGQTTYLTNPEEPGEEPKKFTFDYSYWSHDGFEEKPNGYLGATNPKYADQMKVYNDLGKGVLTNAWEGFNTSLFAYGQTGSGKSWSIVGYGTNKGIVPIFCEEIFKGIDEKKQGGDEAQFEVFFSMLEIYNEKVRDLLNPSTNKGGLRVRQHPSKGFYADGLKTVPVSEYKDIEMRMEEGTTNRTIAAISPADINYDETLSTLRYADRAKQIKTSAKVNEDPTEKLIRELKEENDKLMEMLKKAQAGESVKISADDDDDDGEKEGLSEEEMAELRKQIEEEIKASMAQTEQETQDMNKSWDDRVAENKKDIKDKEAEKKERQSTPHLWNLNPDPQLTGMIVHMVKSGVVKVGNKKGDPPADIVLHGLNILKQHCEIKNEGSKKITIKTFGEAKVLVNGEPVDDDEEEELHHLDRVMFGTSHLYVFHHPAEAQSSSLKQADITYEMAQEEIAKNAGLDVDDQESKEAMLLREDLADLMPMVNEANAISQELDKKVSFEVSVVSAKARGLPEGRPEPYVVMRDLQTGVEYLWPKAKFINRKYVMDEMYENFEDGDDWQLEDEKDPFTESPDVESLIGCVAVPMQSLGYVLDMREQLSITDYKGKELGYLNVEVVPLNENGKEITEEDDIFIDDPSQLDVYCKYSMYLEADLKTEVKSGTRNPEFNYERTFSFERVPPKLIQFLKNKEVIIQLWGKQVVDKKPVNKTAKKGKDTKAIMRAETLKKNVSLTPAVVKGMADNATLKKQNKRLQDKMNHLRQLCDKKQSEGKSDVPISELRAIIGEMNSNTQTTAPHASAPATTGRAPAERRNESSACTIL
ncbi:hypothetical protein pdam_00004872 [Pocillopora damicornis]|uniref:Kinesin motor domain-containing protein n=1 Tax=Pocillopora damicornis TaxID=46731 RepID=A0A3M6TLS5_POCDA|nr:hypothetical protein pdam_00004872 [Pocillopora damicornis]